MAEGRILIVDDKASMLDMLERVLSPTFSVARAADGEAALVRLAVGDIDAVLSDIRMPGLDGLALLQKIQASAIDVEVVLMTAHASIQSAVDAMRAGAFDYLPKPFEPDEAVWRVTRAVEHRRLRHKAQRLEREANGRWDFDQIIGQSSPLQQAFSLLRKAAATDLSVLFLGESGTGKELFARALHHASARAHKPFVAVNCGALPADLIESELFGHVKGAFTGATADHRGLVEEAGDGTLFLDEIGDLPLPLQVKLNRLLQEREYRRVGDSRDRTFAARVIAATNVDLKARVADGRFRDDLFWRLSVFPIALPPVRERREDLPALALHFLRRARARLSDPRPLGLDPARTPSSFSPAALRALSNYSWPGNVRELENVVLRAAAVCDSATIDVADLPADVAQGLGNVLPEGGLARLPYREAIELLHDRATREYLVALMGAVGGNVSRAAERAGVARESLHRLLRKHNIDPDSFRA